MNAPTHPDTMTSAQLAAQEIADYRSEESIRWSDDASYCRWQANPGHGPDATFEDVNYTMSADDLEAERRCTHEVQMPPEDDGGLF